jgi:hypothetical protein
MKPPILYLPNLPKFRYIVKPLIKPLREPWIERKFKLRKQKELFLWERKTNFIVRKEHRKLQKEINQIIKKMKNGRSVRSAEKAGVV